MAKSRTWQFKSRFRQEAYGWNGDRLAIKRLREAVSEIKKVAKKDPILAAEGAVSLMERIWPALQGVDGSSGALGAAVNRTLEALIPLMIKASADKETRGRWLERLYEAVKEDGVNYLSPVEDAWGDICVFVDLANAWADRILPVLRETWADDKPGSWAVGASLCLSCLLKAGRYAEIQQVISHRSYSFWDFDKFWAEALVRQGRVDEAIAYAESHRKHPYEDKEILRFCEQVLTETGREEEAYRRYGLHAAWAPTNLSIYKKTLKQYPSHDPRQVLIDLIEARGDRGKWFAAAKDAGSLDIALDCARLGTTDPKTLIRAARDYCESAPRFAADVALCAIDNLLAGRGYEPTRLDMLNAYRHVMASAERARATEWAEQEVQKLMARGSPPDDRFMHEALVEAEKSSKRKL